MYSLAIQKSASANNNYVPLSALQEDFKFGTNMYAGVKNIVYSNDTYTFDAIIHDYYTIVMPNLDSTNKTDKKLSKINFRTGVKKDKLSVYLDYDIKDYVYTHTVVEYPIKEYYRI